MAIQNDIATLRTDILYYLDGQDEERNNLTEAVQHLRQQLEEVRRKTDNIEKTLDTVSQIFRRREHVLLPFLFSLLVGCAVKIDGSFNQMADSAPQTATEYYKYLDEDELEYDKYPKPDPKIVDVENMLKVQVGDKPVLMDFRGFDSPGGKVEVMFPNPKYGILFLCCGGTVKERKDWAPGSNETAFYCQDAPQYPLLRFGCASK